MLDQIRKYNLWDGNVPELVVFVVGERLGRRYHDAFARMDAQRVEIFHITDRDAVVVAVADDLIFNLLPALEGFFDQELGGEREGLFADFLELFLVVTES